MNRKLVYYLSLDPNKINDKKSIQNKNQSITNKKKKNIKNSHGKKSDKEKNGFDFQVEKKEQNGMDKNSIFHSPKENINKKTKNDFFINNNLIKNNNLSDKKNGEKNSDCNFKESKLDFAQSGDVFLKNFFLNSTEKNENPKINDHFIDKFYEYDYNVEEMRELINKLKIFWKKRSFRYPITFKKSFLKNDPKNKSQYCEDIHDWSFKKI